MDIPSRHVFRVLRDTDVEALHHANSVASACHFLRSKSLLSRGTVERSGVQQTPQESDEADRRFSVWFDIFLDTVDIHHRANRMNVYGPVLFVFDPNIINNNGTGRIWVTKRNPMSWAGRTPAERWFQGRRDLEENFVKGEFDQMIVLRHCGGALPFGRHLRKIVLDDPRRQTEDGIDYFSMAAGALRLAMQESRLDIPIERRTCRRRCTCVDGWAEDQDRLALMFDPKI